MCESGVRIFTSEFTECLRLHGVSKSPKIHPDFLSTLGSLAVDVDLYCGDYYSELVRRESNRIIVLSPKEAFRFENIVHESMKHSAADKSHDFATSTQLALVYVLS